MIPLNSKTLMLSTPVHMYQKLCWECTQLQATLQTDDARTYAYRVLNGAITALHMRDWVSEVFLPAHYAALQAAGFTIQDKAALNVFLMNNTCFRFCESVANAAKHFRIHTRDPEVTTSAKRLGGDETGCPEIWVPMVEDGESSMPIYMAVGEVARMWGTLLLASGYATFQELEYPFRWMT